MPAYSKTTWVNGSTPAINATNLNKIEQGIADAVRKDGSEAMTAQLITVAGSAATPAIAPTGDTNTGIFFPAADTIAFGEGGAEAMRINSSGQVGIGTTSPTALVSMHGAPQATSGAILTLRDTTATGANTTYGAISFLSSPGTDFSIGKASENANSALAFRNANTGAEFMRITSGGNVGIGTTSIPSVFGTTVKVAGSTGATIQTSATNVNLIQFTSDALSLAGVGTLTNHPLQFLTNDIERMRIDSNGYVSIGATSAGAAKLRVEDASSAKIYSVRTGGATLSIEGGSSAGFVKTITNHNLNLGANNTDYLTITTAGYLLIGYTSSNGAYPLQVNGQIFATSSTIATSDGRYKKDVVALDGALDIVKALNPVQFSWKDHPVHKFNTDVPTVGFIAQEVEQALADKSYLTSIIKKSECTWETETGETIEREVTRDVEKQVEREITEEIDGEEVTRTVTETIIEQVTEIVTEPVKETHTEEFLGIAESNLIAILTKAVKELAQEVEALKARI